MLLPVFDLFYWDFDYGTSKLMGSIKIAILERLWLLFFSSVFMKGARQATALSFWHAFLLWLLTWSSNFKSLSIVTTIAILIPNCYSFFVFDSMGEPSISAVDGSLQLKRSWLLSQLAFIKLLLNHVKSGSCDDSNVLTTNSLFSLTVYIDCGVIRITCNI